MRDDGGWDIFFRFFIDTNAWERTNAQNILDWDWDRERLEAWFLINSNPWASETV
jgi:hypothetical protein